MQYCDHSIKEVASSNEQILRIVYENMLKLRRKSRVIYRPFTYFPQLDVIHKAGADFRQIFPEHRDGDYVFLGFEADGAYERELIMNVVGNPDAEVYFNGKRIPVKKSDFWGEDSVDANIIFRKGRNRICVKAVAKENSFEAYVRILIPELRMGAGSYVYYARPYIEQEGFRGQSAMTYSQLYHKDEQVMVQPEQIEWIFPKKPKQSAEKIFDFFALCSGKGKAAYVYTECKGKLLLKHTSPIRIFSDQKLLYHSDAAGKYEAEYDEFTPLLIKSMKSDAWGFEAIAYGENRLSFVTDADCPDLQWIWAGPFGREKESPDYPYVPERTLDFAKPMPSICGNTVYWKFYRKDTYLHQYVETAFWGQWFYAIMVGLEGMRQAAMKLREASFYDYFLSFIQTICTHRDYAKYDTDELGYASYMPHSVRLDNLDAIGTFGINITEYYLMTGDEAAKNVLKTLSDAMMQDVPRFPDGTFYRGKTMWTDDMYMCLPFLARLGAVTGLNMYFDEAAGQIFGFYKRLYMQDQNLYSHIYFPEEDFANHIPWGRGNGWVLLAISEVLMLMPKDHSDYAAVLEIFQRFASGILHFRDAGEKLWHQIVNDDDSYIETSGSAMFITALARGVTYGWLEETIKEDVLEAWNALTEKCIDSEGNVYGVCQGSGCNKEKEYYLQLETIVNDDHGVGIVLGAGAAVMEMLGE